MVTIIFETHGTTLDNQAGLASGHYDARLSPLGEKQAAELGHRYRNIELAAVFCSDLERSYVTAEIAFAGRDIPVIRDSRLRECDYGRFTRRENSSVNREKPERVSVPFPEGESYEQCALWMKSFLQSLLRDYEGKTVMVVGHRATQYALEHFINHLPLELAITAPWQWQPGWAYELSEI